MDLAQSLQNRDFGFLKIIARLWDLRIEAPDFKNGVTQLLPMLANADNLATMMDKLSENAQNAIWYLVSNNGRVSWSLFTRRYGEIKEMGAAQRDRAKPYLDDQITTTEMLWYRAIVGRAFFETPDGLQEFAYMPEELLALLTSNKTSTFRFNPGRRAAPAEKAYVFFCGDTILDDATTFLSGVRAGFSTDLIQSHLICGQGSTFPLTINALREIVDAGGLLDPAGLPDPEKTREFLEENRSELMRRLFQAWSSSLHFNEMRLLPGLLCEGEWRNNPYQARHILLDYLQTIPGLETNQSNAEKAPFWSLSSFIAAVKQYNPDFQRSAGEYETWFITRRKDGKNLRGFENWDQVEAELIRFMIGGPLFWLGVFDLGFPEKPQNDKQVDFSSFRFTGHAYDLFASRSLGFSSKEEKKLIVKTDGIIVAPLLVPRLARYQVARFCEWRGFSRGDYLYQLTPVSLKKAGTQNLQVQQLLTLLNRFAQAIPKNLTEALRRWEMQGSEAHVSRETVLRVKRPEVIQALRKSPANRFLSEQLGPVAVIVRPGAYQKVVSALISMGYLTDLEIEPEQ